MSCVCGCVGCMGIGLYVVCEVVWGVWVCVWVGVGVGLYVCVRLCGV